MANKDNHRRFGNIRKRESGRYQIRYPGPDGRMRSGTETYERKSDAERALSLIEAQIIKGEWTDPERGKVKLKDYAETWIAQRPGLRPRTVDLYRWLLKKHIAPYLGNVQVAKISTSSVRQWRADLLGNGVSVGMAAKAYRLLRAVLMTACEDDRLIPHNPCRIRGAGDEHAAARPVLSVAQVFELAGRVGLRPIATCARSRTGSIGCASNGTARCARILRSSSLARKPNGRCGRWDGRQSGLHAGPPVPCHGPSGHLREPALGRGQCATPDGRGPRRAYGPSTGGLRGALVRRPGARPAQVESGTANRGHPAEHHPDPARAHGHLRQGRAGITHVPRGQGARPVMTTRGTRRPERWFPQDDQRLMAR